MVQGDPRDKHRRSAFGSAWLYLIIFGIIALVGALIVWLVQRATPWYFWALLAGGGILLVIGIILLIIWIGQPSKAEKHKEITKWVIKKIKEHYKEVKNENAR